MYNLLLKKLNNSKKMSKNKKEEDEQIIFKIITLGNSGVGKTSIIKRYVFNQFDQSAISSIGVIFSFKDVLIGGDENKKVKLKLIDTAGEEKYRSLSKTYYKNAEAVLFVFALNNEESFTEITDWLKTFKENSNTIEIPKYLIGNKSDLERVIDNEKIEECSQSNNLKYIETSAKDNQNIDDLFNEIANNLYESYIKKAGLNNKQNVSQLKLTYKGQDKKGKSNCCRITGDP